MSLKRNASLVLAASALVVFAPLHARAQQAKQKVVLEYDDQERLARRKTDTNGDGRFDETVFYKNDVPERAEIDTNHDAEIDQWITYDVNGKELAQERDTNFDGKRDQWIQLENGQPKVQRDDENGDSQPESVVYFEGGARVRSEEDSSGDGRIDRWVIYQGGQPVRVEEDTSGDGKVDVRGEFNPDGSMSVEVQDTDRVGKFDVTIRFEKGV